MANAIGIKALPDVIERTRELAIDEGGDICRGVLAMIEDLASFRKLLGEVATERRAVEAENAKLKQAIAKLKAHELGREYDEAGRKANPLGITGFLAGAN